MRRPTPILYIRVEQQLENKYETSRRSLIPIVGVGAIKETLIST